MRQEVSFFLNSIKRPKTFESTLDKGRTASVFELLTDENKRKSLKCQWISIKRVLEILHFVALFFESVNLSPDIPGYKGLPWIFFQSYDLPNDRKAFQRIAQKNTDFEITTKKGLHPHVLYLHFHAAYFTYGIMQKTQKGFFIIPPLYGFSNNYCKDNEKDLFSKEHIVGMQIPDIPFLLDVTADTASVYFASMVSFQYIKGFFSEISESLQFVYDVLVKFAMQVKENKLSTKWDDFVLQEVSNPYFFLEAQKRIFDFEKKKNSELSDEQLYFLSEVKKKYTKDKIEKENELFWKIPQKIPKSKKIKYVEEKIHEIITVGFIQNLLSIH